ncbi:hypothetical protein [Streptomyces sp. NPDC058766]
MAEPGSPRRRPALRASPHALPAAVPHGPAEPVPGLDRPWDAARTGTR